MKSDTFPRSSLFGQSLLFAIAISLIGCGGTASNPINNGQPSMPTTSATPPATGSGGGSNSGSTSSGGGANSGSGAGSGSGTSGGGSGTTTSGNSSTAISGTIVNSQTGVPVSGTVAVALEGAPLSDFVIMAQTTADAQGHFRFDDVQPSPRGWGWTIGVSARSSDGTLFTPTLLVSHNVANGSTGDAIEPGTDVGTITVVPSPTGTIRGSVFSQSSEGAPQSINVSVDPMRVFVLDRHFSVPWIDGAPKFTTHNGDPACGTQTDACSSFTITLPTANAWIAIYDQTGNQFHTNTTGESYSATFNASSTATGAQDCNPSSLEQFFGGFGSTSEIVANSQPHFQSCAP